MPVGVAIVSVLYMLDAYRSCHFNLKGIMLVKCLCLFDYCYYLQVEWKGYVCFAVCFEVFHAHILYDWLDLFSGCRMP
jgi:hypothetical protein